MCVLVYLINLRTSLVGRKQINTTYASEGVNITPWEKRFEAQMESVPVLILAADKQSKEVRETFGGTS